MVLSGTDPQQRRRVEGTNVINKDLTSSTGWRGDSTSWAAVTSGAKATSAWTSFVTSAPGCWTSESWFGLAILDAVDEYSIYNICKNALGVIWKAYRTYLANVDKSAHQILIGKCVDCLLGLLPCGVFHNPDSDQLKQRTSWSRVTYPHPYITRGQCPNPSIQRPTTKKNQKDQPFYVLAPTFDIPFGSNRTSAKRTSPAIP